MTCETNIEMEFPTILAREWNPTGNQSQSVGQMSQGKQLVEKSICMEKNRGRETWKKRDNWESRKFTRYGHAWGKVGGTYTHCEFCFNNVQRHLEGGLSIKVELTRRKGWWVGDPKDAWLRNRVWGGDEGVVKFPIKTEVLKVAWQDDQATTVKKVWTSLWSWFHSSPQSAVNTRFLFLFSSFPWFLANVIWITEFMYCTKMKIWKISGRKTSKCGRKNISDWRLLGLAHQLGA